MPIADTLDLVCCDNLNFNSDKFTYYHQSLNQSSAIDHVFVSKQLVSSVHDYIIVSSGENCSDHLPISFKCHLDPSSDITHPASDDVTVKLEFK